jgi:hypothetical protein
LQAVLDRKLRSQPVTMPGGLTMSWGTRGSVSIRTARGARLGLRPLSLGGSSRAFSPGPFVFGRKSVTERLGLGVTAWYKTAASGLEQGFTVSRRPAGTGSRFSIVLAATSRVRSYSAESVVLSGRDGPVLTYGGLSVTDAAGRPVPARLAAGSGQVRIVVDDAHASFPLTVDPYIVPASTPSAVINGVEGSYEQLGYSAALSADGQTALVGVRDANNGDGGAYLYVESGGTWPATPTAAFTAPAGSSDFLGASVALSADGNTALVGGGLPGDSIPDVAYLYTAASGWSNTPAAMYSYPLSSSGPVAVALSGDGQNALIGVQYANGSLGAAFLYTESAGTWPATPTMTFPGLDPYFGASVALSADGSTVLVGDIGSGNSGTAYLYTDSSGAWSATPEAAFTSSTWSFGYSVALSGDGQTAFIGAPFADINNDGYAGAAYLYTAAPGWSNTPAMTFLPTGGPEQQFGTSVALSDNGQVALIGDPGALEDIGAGYLYTASPGWSSTPAATFAGVGEGYGYAVAISGDGETALVGAYALGGGAAYVYTPPSLASTTTSVSSSENPSMVGDAVTYTATVSGPSGTLPSSGETVAFDDAGSPISGCGSLALATSAPYTAACTVTYTATAGSPHSITAAYGGDSAYAPSTSSALIQTVNPAVPGQPTGVSATAGNGSATVSFSPPSSNGGSPITSYTVTASDVTNPANGGQTATGAGSPLTVTGLAGGDAYTFTVTATSAAGTSQPSQPSNVVTVEESPAITSPTSASTGMREPFSFTVTTTGVPTAAITETGALPTGVTLADNGDGTATLGGTAPAGSAGSYPITITASNGAGSPASQAFTLTVTTATSKPAITSSAADTATFGVPFSFTITTTGYPVPKITRTGALPAGVTFTDNGDGTATISGTPAKAAVGAYPLTLTAKSTAGTATQTLTLTITKSPVIKKIPSTTGQVGTALHLAITASGDTTPAIAESGTLPAGLSFTDNGNGTAAITGTPAAGSGGSYPLTITATNQLGTATQTFTLTIDQRPAITSAATAAAATGSSFSFPVTATGYPAPKITETGKLPAGITFKAATATFTGTPKTGTGGTYPIAITATNKTGTTTQNFTLTIS